MHKFVPAAITGCLLLILIALIGFSPDDQLSIDPATELIHSESMVEIPPSPTVDLFGFVIDQSDYIDDQIRRNESLYIILDRYGVSPQQIYEIQQQASDNIDFN
ncbi:MAG: hypothetical protein R3283_07555, partial [Balneolaceae bacterium]|nr:hypothetical protein [Balneolaceae bacterium]